VRVCFAGGRSDSTWQEAAVVLRHAVFPLQEVRDGLWFDANFYAAKAGEQQVHLFHQADHSALIYAFGFYDEAYFAAGKLEQTPVLRQFSRLDNPGWREVQAFGSQSFFGLQAERFDGVGEEIGTRGLAFDHDGVAEALPSDGVGDLSGGAILLGQNDAASVARAEPIDREGNEFGMLDRARFAHDFL